MTHHLSYNQLLLFFGIKTSSESDQVGHGARPFCQLAGMSNALSSTTLKQDLIT
jgi:hypothetical protein